MTVIKKIIAKTVETSSKCTYNVLVAERKCFCDMSYNTCAVPVSRIKNVSFIMLYVLQVQTYGCIRMAGADIPGRDISWI